jgi:hypothetical protein
MLRLVRSSAAASSSPDISSTICKHPYSSHLRRVQRHSDVRHKQASCAVQGVGQPGDGGRPPFECGRTRCRPAAREPCGLRGPPGGLGAVASASQPADMAPATASAMCRIGDIHLQHRFGMVVFVAAHDFAGDPGEVTEPVEPAADQHGVDGGPLPKVGCRSPPGRVLFTPQVHDVVYTAGA